MLKQIEIKDSVGTRYLLQFLPKQLEEFSAEEFFYFKEKKLKVSFVIDLIHNLLLKFFFRKENEFILSSIVLKSNYGKFYNYYIDYLVEKQFLILKKNYSVGKKSRIYKLSESLYEEKIIRFKNKDKSLIKRRNNKKNNLNPKNKINSVLKLRLIENLNKVKIDYDMAKFYLMSIITDKETLNRNLYSIDTIENNYLFWQFDDFGRFHSNFTILKSFIRKNCLILNGEKIKEIDIPNSQPLFLLNLIKNSNITYKHAELELFKDLVMKGELYDFLQSKTKNKTREETKTMVYHVLFGKNGRSSADSLFKKNFPSLHNFIIEFKKSRGDYRALSYELQSAESNFIFNQVLVKFSSLYPDAAFITVHDSIMVAESNFEICNQIFKNCLSDLFLG